MEAMTFTPKSLAIPSSPRYPCALRLLVPLKSTKRKRTPAFWRPRGFWDDLDNDDDDDESDFGNEGYLAGEAELCKPIEALKRRESDGGRTYVSFGRRMGGLQLKRRLSSSAVRKRQTATTDVSKDDNDILADRKEWKPVWRLSFSDRLPSFDLEGRRRMMPGLPALQDHIVQRRIRKEEDRREKERERLRNSTGMIISQPDARIA
ncbi:hypothetical protein MMC25_003565 [Agyrium rufum]|nr:hypothetical protein [Agyrium rufum]